MKNDISRNVSLNSGEKVVKHFTKLQAIGMNAQIMLTTKRLIIYTQGIALSKGKKVKRKMMNEIDLSSIHRFEYYQDSKKYPGFIRFLGLVLFLGAAAGFYLYFKGSLTLPAYPYQMIYTDYAAFAIIALFSLMLMFHTKKLLKANVKSGLQETTSLTLDSNKYNELALRYLAGKIHRQ